MIDKIIGQPDAAYFDTSNDDMRLIVCLNKPTQNEIEEIRKGRIELRLLHVGRLLFVLSHIGKKLEMDSPYDAGVHILANQQINPKLFGNLLTIELYDTDNGQMLSSRMIGLADNFAAYIEQCATEQLNWPTTQKDYDAQIQAAYQQYTWSQMWTEAKSRYVVGQKTGLVEPYVKREVTADVPEELPKELHQFYKYTADAGKCLLAIPYQFEKESIDNPLGYQIPLPVRYVLAFKHSIKNKYLYCEVKYDRLIGAVVPEEYYEW